VIEKLKQRMARKKNTEDTVEEVEVKKAKKSSKKQSSKEQIKELEAQVAESKDKFLRLYAEFENYKKRTIKEKLDLMKTASQDVMQKMLPVLDDFDRAKKSADDDSSPEHFTDGVRLLYEKLHGTLTQKGLQAMESTGEIFDPELHNAITEIPAPTDEMKGKVIDTIEKGYYLNDKIIRHAKVVVGK